MTGNEARRLLLSSVLAKDIRDGYGFWSAMGVFEKEAQALDIIRTKMVNTALFIRAVTNEGTQKLKSYTDYSRHLWKEVGQHIALVRLTKEEFDTLKYVLVTSVEENGVLASDNIGKKEDKPSDWTPPSWNGEDIIPVKLAVKIIADMYGHGCPCRIEELPNVASVLTPRCPQEQHCAHKGPEETECWELYVRYMIKQKLQKEVENAN